jgi:hypothetical protein
MQVTIPQVSKNNNLLHIYYKSSEYLLQITY